MAHLVEMNHCIFSFDQEVKQQVCFGFLSYEIPGDFGNHEMQQAAAHGVEDAVVLVFLSAVQDFRGTDGFWRISATDSRGIGDFRFVEEFQVPFLSRRREVAALALQDEVECGANEFLRSLRQVETGRPDIFVIEQEADQNALTSLLAMWVAEPATFCRAGGGQLHGSHGFKLRRWRSFVI